MMVGLYGGPSDGIEKETEKNLDPGRLLLTRRSGGNDRTLPPRVRSTLEWSKSPGVTTEHVRSPLIGHSLSLVDPVFVFFA